MAEFNSDDHYVYYCGPQSLRRNGIAFILNKSVWNAVWVQSQKQQNDLCSFPSQTIQYHSNPSLCLTSNAEETEVEWFYEDLQDLVEKRYSFYYRGLEYKSRKLRDTWSNKQIWPWSTKWSRAKANRVLPREHTGLSTRSTREDYTWTSPDGQYRNQIDYIPCSQNGEALYSQQKQDKELTVAQIMNSLLPNSDLNWSREIH